MPTLEKQFPESEIIFRRHAERLIDGSVSPEGEQHAKEEGKEYGKALVYKTKGSDDSSGRAFNTAKGLSESAGVKSGMTGKVYETRKARDIQYDEIKKEFEVLVKKGVALIEKKTFEEIEKYNETAEKKLPAKMVDGKVQAEGATVGEIAQISKIRQNNQKFGFDQIFENSPDVVHRLAFCSAHDLMHNLEVLKRYKSRYGKKLASGVVEEEGLKSEGKKVVLDDTSHGMFSEALFREAGTLDGNNVKGENLGLKAEQIGGYLNPLESFSLKIENPDEIPDLIPVAIKRNDGSKQEVFLSYKKLQELEEDYQSWDGKAKIPD